MQNTQNTLPKNLHKYFWGDNLYELNWQDHNKYITQTLLEKGDVGATAWLLKTADRSELLEQLPELKLTPKSFNFWNIYLS